MHEIRIGKKISCLAVILFIYLVVSTAAAEQNGTKKKSDEDEILNEQEEKELFAKQEISDLSRGIDQMESNS
jgi:uncharacterized membrane protein